MTILKISSRAKIWWLPCHMAGYIKRVPLVTYRAQKRGGKGRSGIDLKEDDAVIDLYVANTHTTLVVLYHHAASCTALKVYKLPLGNPQARGKAHDQSVAAGAGRENQLSSCRCPMSSTVPKPIN